MIRNWDLLAGYWLDINEDPLFLSCNIWNGKTVCIYHLRF